ncbi:unnamed protein product, partial [marine sediment metagenome]
PGYYYYRAMEPALLIRQPVGSVFPHRNIRCGNVLRRRG